MPRSSPDLHDEKTLVPSDMRTAEWSRVPQWLRERTFYMAGVADAEILSEFARETRGIVEGSESIEQARKRLEQFLDRVGYRPAPGQEGTIKDLRSARRIVTVLETNKVLLAGWAQKERGLQRGAEIAFPAWELIRVVPKAMPRAWPARWVAAGGTLVDGRMIAPKNSPVWAELGSKVLFEDALGVDYPPFAWGSGMDWKAISRGEALTLGVIDKDWRPMALRPVASPNETLETTPRVTEPALREALANEMKGLAEWQGDRFVFTDPNGTQPMTAEKLAEVWSLGMPERFADLPGSGLYQKEALAQFVADPEKFVRQVDEATGDDIGLPPGRLDLYDDLLRLFTRVAPVVAGQKLVRAIRMADAGSLQAFLQRVRRDGYVVPGDRPGEAWLHAGREGKAALKIVCSTPKTAKNVSALTKAADAVFLGGTKFRVVKITEGNPTTVEVEEL